MAELAISRTFLAAYAELPRADQRRVDSALGRLDSSRDAIHLETYPLARDSRVRTFRVDQYYRGVVLALGKDINILLTVKPHDEAISYANSLLLTVNQGLGVFEVRDDERLAALQSKEPSTERGLFAEVSDSDLLRLGVEPDLLPTVRAITTERQLEGLADVLPDMQFDILLGLATGMSADEIFAELADRLLTDVDPSNLPEISRRSRMKIVDDIDDARRIIDLLFSLQQPATHDNAIHSDIGDELPPAVDGRHIDSVTAFFNKVLDSLGPPPDPADFEQDGRSPVPLSPVVAR
ncbi:hypothetical protein ABZ783_33905 [Micromonospora sp. NPDC047738]|uniref:hypothetical protein n=1 Tax=Micromonospora sp. NPDC047738 TaxID=3155741 RepID=UPI0033D1D34B